MDHSPAVLHERMKASLYFKELTSEDGFFGLFLVFWVVWVFFLARLLGDFPSCHPLKQTQFQSLSCKDLSV